MENEDSDNLSRVDKAQKFIYDKIEDIFALTLFITGVFVAELLVRIFDEDWGSILSWKLIPIILLGIFAYIIWKKKSEKVEALDKLKENIKDCKALLEEKRNQCAESQTDLLDIFKFITKCIGELTFSFKDGDTNEERISLYSHNGEVFYITARYSENPIYEKENRKLFSSDQGAISKAWQNKVYFNNDYPDPDTDPEAYYEYLEKNENIPREVAENLVMKPKWIFGIRIDDDFNKKKLGIFIIESTNRDYFKSKKDVMEHINSSGDFNACIEILMRMKWISPIKAIEWEKEGRCRP